MLLIIQGVEHFFQALKFLRRIKKFLCEMLIGASFKHILLIIHSSNSLHRKYSEKNTAEERIEEM